MTENETKKFSLYLEPGLHRGAKVKAAQTGVTLNEVIRAFLERWLSGQEDVVASPPAGGPRNPEAHQLLDFILEHDPKAGEWIIGNLKMFAEAIRSRKARAERRKAG